MEKEPVYYSKEELAEFEQIIRDKITTTRKQAILIAETFRKEMDIKPNPTQLINKKLKKVYTPEQERLRKQVGELIMYDEQLYQALRAIEFGIYGVCRISGKLIPKEILLGDPLCTIHPAYKA